MTAIPKKLISPEEYLLRERKAETKSEFLRGEVFAMAGASFEHCRIANNMIVSIGSQLGKGPCQQFNSDLRVKVERTGLYTYPDIIIVCDPPQFEDNVLDTLLNPTVVIEVLSPSTESYDRGKKFRHYQAIPSLREYVLVAQSEVSIDRFVRDGPDGWSVKSFDNRTGEFAFSSVPVRIAMEDVYFGVEFRE
jgi:Uma2 family endonuclease